MHSGGPARRYDAATHQVLAFADADNFGFLEYGALDGDGSVVLTAPGVAVDDGARKRTSTLPSAPGGVALDASGRYAFVLGQYFVRVYDLTTGAPIMKIPTWADARPIDGSGGNLAVNSDGSVVALAKRSGVTVLPTGL